MKLFGVWSAVMWVSGGAVFAETGTEADRKAYTVGANTPLVDGPFTQGLCASILRHAHQSAVPDLLTIEPEDISLVVTSETFTRYYNPKVTNEFLVQLKTLLMTSRVLNGEGTYFRTSVDLGPQANEINSAGGGDILREDPYGNLVVIAVSARAGSWQYPVTLKKEEGDAGFTEDRAVIIPTPRWTIRIGEPIYLTPKVLSADPESAYLIQDPEREIPDEVFSRLNAFDYWMELANQPHSVDSYNAYINTDGSHGLRISDPRYYAVMDGTGEPVGYLVELQMEVFYESNNADALYQNHFSGIAYRTTQAKNEKQILIRFDARGNRISRKGE